MWSGHTMCSWLQGPRLLLSALLTLLGYHAFHQKCQINPTSGLSLGARAALTKYQHLGRLKTGIAPPFSSLEVKVLLADGCLLSVPPPGLPSVQVRLLIVSS